MNDVFDFAWRTTQATCMLGSIMFVAALYMRRVRQHPMKPVVDMPAEDGNKSFGYGLSLRDAINPVANIDFNSYVPIEIDTPLFQGNAYVLLRNPQGDARWDPLFQGKQRMIWVMVQGQFKRQPKGVVYLAGELPRSMDLSMWTKAWASMIIASVKTLISKLHFSFGSEKEAPHIALPLYQSADQLVATPLDEVPPKLGRDSWGESPKQQQERKATPVGQEVFRTDMVYSFQFHTMYVDLTTWSLVNLPGINDVSLKNFFGDMALRLSVYEHVPKPNEVAHISKEYCFAFDVSCTDSESTTTEPEDSAATSCVSKDVIIDFTGIEFHMWMWLEYFDATQDLRHVAYVLVVRQGDSKVYTVILPSEAIELIMRLNGDNTTLITRARREFYMAIEDQVIEVGRQLHSVIKSGTGEARKELHHWLTTQSPMTLAAANTDNSLGVSIWSWRRSSMNICKEGSAYRILSDTFLRQEYMVLTSEHLSFYRTYSSSSLKKLPIAHITHVTCRHLHDLFVLVIYTWTEVVYVHVPDPLAWQDAIVNLCERSPIRQSSAFLKMTNWTPFNALTYEGYLVLNSRKVAHDEVDQEFNLFAVAEQCVQAAANAWTSRTLENKVFFQKQVQRLRFLDLNQLSTSEQRMAFFFNVYQSLYVHLHLTIEEPTTVCMHQVVYEVGVQKLLLSLAEIEHVILRGGLPTIIDAPYLDEIPQKSSYPAQFSSIACNRKDFRISIALYGHRIDKNLVVYEPNCFHEQVNAMVSSTLQPRVKVSESTIHLPV
ncbi:hypothetical protein THRCLA_00587, partial [Thraustotheca clavata]